MLGWIDRLARWTALVGGCLLLALILMVVLSVSGRALSAWGLGPVPGDFELVEIGMAVAIFCSLPWCCLRGGHATVDVLFERMPASAQRAVAVLSDLLMLLVWLVLSWKLWDGLWEKRAFMETTFILQFPLWWGYALCFVAAGVGCLAYMAKALGGLGLLRKSKPSLHTAAVEN